MRIACRTDSSLEIGTGHLWRCLSQALAEQGAEVTLVVRRLDGVASQVLDGCGFPVHWLPPPTAGDAPDADGSPHRDWAQVPWWREAVQSACRILGAQSVHFDDLPDDRLDSIPLLDHSFPRMI